MDVTVVTPLATSAISSADSVHIHAATQHHPGHGLRPGRGRTRVTVIGTGLANATVLFGSNPGTIISDTDGQIVVISPEATNDSPGTVNLAVTTAYGTSTGQFTFTYALLPAVTAISPSLARRRAGRR